MRCAPLLRALLTSVDTGCIVNTPVSAGTMSGATAAASVIAGSSQVAKSVGSRMTGMRSCTGAMVSFAEVVRIVQLRTTTSSPASCPFHWAHSPAKASGAPSARRMKYGCFALRPATAAHS